MIQKKISIPDDVCAFVRVTAKKRKVTEAALWRELIAVGYRYYSHEAPDNDVENKNNLDAKIDLILRASVQSLMLARRVAGNVDETLVAKAHEDALGLLEKSGMI